MCESKVINDLKVVEVVEKNSLIQSHTTKSKNEPIFNLSPHDTVAFFYPYLISFLVQINQEL